MAYSFVTATDISYLYADSLPDPLNNAMASFTETSFVSTVLITTQWAGSASYFFIPLFTQGLSFGWLGGFLRNSVFHYPIFKKKKCCFSQS